MIAKMMEITTKIGCSLQCRFCPQKRLASAYFRTGNEAVLMSFETFRSCIDKIPVDVDIHFSGMCEPWLNPDCTKMLLYAHKKKHRIHIYTTLVGMTEADYFQIRSIGLEAFVLHVPDAEGNAGFVITDKYLKFLRKIISDTHAGAFRVDSFSCHGSLHPAIKQLVENTGIRCNSKMNNRAGNVSADCNFFPTKPLTGDIVCRWCGGTTLDKNVLLPNGTVLMCCMDYGIEYPLGNLLEQSFSAISEGDLKQCYRQRMHASDVGNILCRSCSRARPATEYSTNL